MHLDWSGNGSLPTAELFAETHNNSSMWEASGSNRKRPCFSWKHSEKEGSPKNTGSVKVGISLFTLPAWIFSWLSSWMPVATFLLLSGEKSLMTQKSHSYHKWILPFSKRWWFGSILDTEMSQVWFEVRIFTNLRNLLGLWKWWHFFNVPQRWRQIQCGEPSLVLIPQHSHD